MIQITIRVINGKEGVFEVYHYLSVFVGWIIIALLTVVFGDALNIIRVCIYCRELLPVTLNRSNFVYKLIIFVLLIWLYYLIAARLS